MSFPQRRAQSTAAEPFTPARPRSVNRQIERRERQRHRIHRRQDVAVGVFVAFAALVLGPGLAVVTIGAVLVLLVCGLSYAFVRLRGRRSGGRRSRRLDRPR
jgi:anti-sigma factor RsiW